MEQQNKYTCYEYRQEMQLLGLRMRLQDADLTEAEKQIIQKNIEALEAEMGIS